MNRRMIPVALVAVFAVTAWAGEEAKSGPQIPQRLELKRSV